MKYHTFICGTSKSRNEKGYYIKEQDKFWGSIKEAGLTNTQFSPYEYKRFEKMGFKFTDIVDAEEYIISQDRLINTKHVQTGLDSFNKLLKRYKPKRILFNGKKAAEWFLRDQIGLKTLSTKNYITRELEYGRQHFEFTDIVVFILPSTSGAASKYWKKEPWIEAWKDCKKDIK